MSYWLKGTIYLLHFEPRYKHAQHYLGITENLESRIAEHRSGHGARLLEVVVGAGVEFVVARTWPNGTRAQERAKKGRGLAPLCPICRERAKKEKSKAAKRKAEAGQDVYWLTEAGQKALEL